MSYSVIIAAAGKSTRFADCRNKLLYPLADGEPVIARVVRAYVEDPDCFEIVLVVSPELFEEYRKPLVFPGKMVITLGGADRQASIYNGLLAVAGDKVLIHDGARPWVSRRDIRAVAGRLDAAAAVCLTAPVTDTIKEIRGGKIVGTIERDSLRRALTPQGFHYKEIVECYRKAEEQGIRATDDAQLYQLVTGKEVAYVDARDYNEKITTLEDVKGR